MSRVCSVTQANLFVLSSISWGQYFELSFAITDEKKKKQSEAHKREKHNFLMEISTYQLELLVFPKNFVMCMDLLTERNKL